ncbi:MAG: hypothetical protein WKF79_01515 [Nocardioides sp.]
MNETDDRLRHGLRLLSEEAPRHDSMPDQSAGSMLRAPAARRGGTMLVSLAAAAAVASLVAGPVLISRLDSERAPTASPDKPVSLRIMFAEPVVFSGDPSVEMRGKLGSNESTGCLELDGKPLFLPPGSLVIDDSTVEIHGLGTMKVGETVAGLGRPYGVVRGEGRPEELAADSYLACMGTADRVYGVDFRPADAVVPEA